MFFERKGLARNGRENQIGWCVGADFFADFVRSGAVDRFHNGRSVPGVIHKPDLLAVFVGDEREFFGQFPGGKRVLIDVALGPPQDFPLDPPRQTASVALCFVLV